MKAVKLPADLDPRSVTAIVDTREQLPLDLQPLRTETGTLATGDYSIKGLEDVVSIERKSLPDLLGCMGGGRERFERELQRMLGYPARCVVVEATWLDLLEGRWQSSIRPASATGSVLGWIAGGVPFLFAGDRSEAALAVSRMLFIVARRQWRLVRGFATEVTREPGEEG